MTPLTRDTRNMLLGLLESTGRVVDAISGVPYEGAPSLQLFLRGAVSGDALAARRGADNVWHYVPDDEVFDVYKRGGCVTTVRVVANWGES